MIVIIITRHLSKANHPLLGGHIHDVEQCLQNPKCKIIDSTDSSTGKPNACWYNFWGWKWPNFHIWFKGSSVYSMEYSCLALQVLSLSYRATLHTLYLAPRCPPSFLFVLSKANSEYRRRMCPGCQILIFQSASPSCRPPWTASSATSWQWTRQAWGRKTGMFFCS